MSNNFRLLGRKLKWKLVVFMSIEKGPEKWLGKIVKLV
jgi:hypothetical protein